MILARTYTFSAAHFLPFMPKDQKNGRIHGHTYDATIILDGPLDPEKKWVVDGVFLDWAWQGVHAELDHFLLNERGIPIPTSEMIAKWILVETSKNEHVGKLVYVVELERKLDNCRERVRVERRECEEIPDDVDGDV